AIDTATSRASFTVAPTSAAAACRAASPVVATPNRRRTPVGTSSEQAPARGGCAPPPALSDLRSARAVSGERRSADTLARVASATSARYDGHGRGGGTTSSGGG